ncbi:MAG: PH domain-containing protein [Myxococcota bacterium]
MSEPAWRQVHPASFAVNLVPRAWSVLRSAWPLLLAVWWGGRSAEGVANLATIAVFFGTAFASSLVHQLTLRYRVNGDRLEIRTGLLSRQARSIAVDRVQNVVMVRNLYHRLSGLCEVRIETASGREVEGLLSAVSIAEAERLIAALSAHRAAAPTDVADEVLIQTGLVDLMWSGFADLRLGALAVVLGGLVEWFPQGEGAADLARRFDGAAGGALLVALVTGTWLVGIGGTVLRRYGFRLVRGPRGLVAEHGLLTRRRTELRPNKVQVVSWIEPLVLRWVGLGSVQVDTAAAREGGSGTERAEAVVPAVDLDRARVVVQAALRTAEDPVSWPLSPPHPRALLRAALGTTARFVGAGAVATALFGGWGAAVVGVALVLALEAARRDVATQGWSELGRLLISRRGFWVRTTTVLDRSKVQSATVHRAPWMRDVGLVVVHVAGGRVVLPLLALDTANRLTDGLVSPGERHV